MNEDLSIHVNQNSILSYLCRSTVKPTPAFVNLYDMQLFSTFKFDCCNSAYSLPRLYHQSQKNKKKHRGDESISKLKSDRIFKFFFKQTLCKMVNTK